MIRVSIYKNDKHEYVGFRAIGHAGYADQGQDIVCAAASVLLVNTMNAIEKFTDHKLSMVSDEKEGLIDFRIEDKPDKETALLLKTMTLGLKEMANDESYENYIDLTFEEV